MDMTSNSGVCTEGVALSSGRPPRGCSVYVSVGTSGRGLCVAIMALARPRNGLQVRLGLVAKGKTTLSTRGEKEMRELSSNEHYNADLH